MTRKKILYSLPPAITVGGMEFKIIFKDMENFGEMDFDKKTICIRKGLTQEEEFDTLIHEVHHASLSISGLSNIIDDENTEEALVRIVDYLVMPVIKQEYKRFIQGK